MLAFALVVDPSRKNSFARAGFAEQQYDRTVGSGNFRIFQALVNRRAVADIGKIIFCQPLLDGRAPAQFPQLDAFFKGQLEVLHFNGLCQEILSAVFNRRHGRGNIAGPGYDDYGRIGVGGFKFRDPFDGIAVRKLQVKQNRVETLD